MQRVNIADRILFFTDIPPFFSHSSNKQLHLYPKYIIFFTPIQSLPAGSPHFYFPVSVHASRYLAAAMKAGPAAEQSLRLPALICCFYSNSRSNLYFKTSSQKRIRMVATLCTDRGAMRCERGVRAADYQAVFVCPLHRCGCIAADLICIGVRSERHAADSRRYERRWHCFRQSSWCRPRLSRRWR